MRHEQDRAPLAPRVQVREHAALGLDVERGGRLVEQQDRRVLQHRARDREPLALAGRELGAALAERRVVAERQLLDELVGARDARRRAHRLVDRVRHRVADVLADRGAEEQVLLQRDRDVPRAGSRRAAGAGRRRRSRRAPRSGSKRRSASAISVLLPAPVGPTTAVIAPIGASNATCASAGRFAR